MLRKDQETMNIVKGCAEEREEERMARLAQCALCACTCHFARRAVGTLSPLTFECVHCESYND